MLKMLVCSSLKDSVAVSLINKYYNIISCVRLYFNNGPPLQTRIVQAKCYCGKQTTIVKS